MGLFKKPKPQPIPKQTPIASAAVRQSEAQKVASVKRRRLSNNSSYKNTIMAGGDSQGYGTGQKTLMGQ